MQFVTERRPLRNLTALDTAWNVVHRADVCNFVEKQVSALSDTRDSLSHVLESAENWLTSQLPPMTDNQFLFLIGLPF